MLWVEKNDEKSWTILDLCSKMSVGVHFSQLGFNSKLGAPTVTISEGANENNLFFLYALGRSSSCSKKKKKPFATSRSEL
jgi:hypothetical protein